MASTGETTPAEDTSFASILSQFEEQHHPSGGGEALRGTVVSISPETVFVDLGRKMDGILSVENFKDPSGNLTVAVGDTLVVNVTGRDQQGNYELSMLKVERPKDWTSFEAAFAEKRTIAAVVTEVIKGGLRVDCGVKAFLPASRSGVRDAADMEKLVGREIQCRIIKLEIETEDVVVDRRVVVEEEERKVRAEAFSTFVEGSVVRGTVRSLTDFGAFVELAPGVDGLLHVADISWTRIAKAADALTMGQSVECKILKISAQTRRIALGLKQLTPEPWARAADLFKVGDRVQGKVSRVADFGAFVELSPGVDGLIHVSEMSWTKKVRKASDVVQPGELVEVLVLGVNAGERRIALGLKQALGDPWEAAETKYAPGAVVEGPIGSLTDFGAFVDLGNSIEGMIHISDITREKRLDHPREMLKAGQVVRAVVVEFDRAKRRIRLSMKQLEPTSADAYIEEHRVDEIVTGRVVDVAHGKAKVELGDGVFAQCRIVADSGESEVAAASGKVDLSSLTAMLSDKWKKGAGSTERSEQARAGQVRSFKIVSMDAEKKRIELELAG